MKLLTAFNVLAATVAVATLCLGATLMVTPDRATSRAMDHSGIAYAFVMDNDLGGKLDALPLGLKDKFSAALAIRSAAIELGTNPKDLSLVACVTSALEDKGVPACMWADTSMGDICESPSKLAEWGANECPRHGRNYQGSTVNPSGLKGKVLCSGKPMLGIQVKCGD